MALGNEGKLLAASLTALKQVTIKIIRRLSRAMRFLGPTGNAFEAAGFLEQIMQGWYAFAKPGGNRRVETAWEALIGNSSLATWRNGLVRIIGSIPLDRSGYMPKTTACHRS